MAIAYSGGTLVKTTINESTLSAYIDAVNAAMVSAGWTSAAITNGYSLTSATTPHGLAMKFRIDIGTGSYTSYARIQATSVDGATGSDQDYVYVAGGRSYEFVANRYSIWQYQLGNFTSNGPGAVGVIGIGNAFYAGVPYLPEPVRPLIVGAATNATPIVITTTVDHNMLTNDACYIQGALGNTAANGNWTITRLSDTTFSLNSSVGNGAYTSGGIVGNRERISRYIYFSGTTGTIADPINGWRNLPNTTASGGALSSRSSVMVNENSWSAVGTFPPLFGATSFPWRGGRFTLTEPYLKNTNTGGGNSMIQAQLYNAMMVTGSVAPAGDTVFSADGYTWIVYSKGAAGTLDLAVVTG